MFDFGVLPPEINSGRIYAGPGSAPMLRAATAWDAMAAELDMAAIGHSSVVSELTSGPWVGPASVSMLYAALPYVAWLRAAAALTEETAIQARAAASAYEAAFAMTFPPTVIAANRALLATLVATNFFGQNTPAIAATEAQYLQMWAQDAGAMYSYSAASAIASELSPFSSPSEVVSSTTKAVDATANAMSAPAAALTAEATRSLPWPLSLLPTPANNYLGLVPANYQTVFHNLLQIYNYYGVAPSSVSIAQQLTFGPGGTTAGSGGAWYPTPQFAHLGTTGGGVSAGIGRSARVGSLAVPSSWTSPTSAPVSAPGSPAAGLDGPSAPSATQAVENNALLNGLPGQAGRRSTAGNVHKYGLRYSVVTRPPSAG